MGKDEAVASLADQIAQFTGSMAKQAPPEVLATLAAELQKLAESGIAGNALRPGRKAPPFVLPDARGGSVSLSGLLGKGAAVVTFYRGGWCPFCNLQLRAYQAVLDRIRERGAELVAVSPQTPDYALSDAEKKELTFPVLSDPHNDVARRYGLVFRLSDALQGLHRAFDNPVPRFNGDDSWELPMPGTFVIDRDGIVRLAHVDPDYTKRLEPAEILAALREL